MHNYAIVPQHTIHSDNGQVSFIQVFGDNWCRFHYRSDRAAYPQITQIFTEKIRGNLQNLRVSRMMVFEKPGYSYEAGFLYRLIFKECKPVASSLPPRLVAHVRAKPPPMAV